MVKGETLLNLLFNFISVQKTESLLRNVEQDQPLSMQNALIPSKMALVSVDLLNHPDSDVRVSVVSCLNEILRITAPEAPYSDDQLKVNQIPVTLPSFLSLLRFVDIYLFGITGDLSVDY